MGTLRAAPATDITPPTFVAAAATADMPAIGIMRPRALGSCYSFHPVSGSACWWASARRASWWEATPMRGPARHRVAGRARLRGAARAAHLVPGPALRVGPRDDPRDRSDG